MDHLVRQLMPFIVIGGAFVMTGVIFYGVWLLGRYRGREDAALPQILNLEQRLQQVETALLEMGGSLERLEEAQRFTARLLTDRSPYTALPRHDTPPH